MLEFFRKYQRFFMINVTVVIIISFCFFGTSSSMGSFEKKKDFVVGSAIDGSDLNYSEIRQLSSLMSLQKSQGIFHQSFLKTGAADLLANAYEEGLKDNWSSRLVKARAARFYSHPSSPYLDARAVWSQLVPGLLEEISALQKLEEGDPKFFPLWSRLYALQESIPPELVQRVLIYHQKQAGLPMDPRLANGDFSLFGCRTLEDWFGREFLDLTSQFILNGSALAKQQGMKVSREEARTDFNKQFGSQQRELQYLGIAEQEAVSLWQKALGFLRWFDEIGQAALVDALPYQKFAEFAQEKAIVDLYSLPQELHFSTLDDLLAFETYTRLTCKQSADALSLPSDSLPLDKVLEKAPELTATTYRVRYSKVDPSTLGASLSLTELWDWQTEEKNWTLLSKNFSPLKGGETADERFAILEKLDPTQRRSIDAWSRLQIALDRPEWIESAFLSANVEEKEISVSKDHIDGLEIQAPKEFESLLVRALVNDPEAIEALRDYREKEAFFRIEEVELVKGISILSFTEAKEKKRIPIESFLEEEYRRIRSQSPSSFKTEEGDWKPLSEVREKAIRVLFSDLFKQIDRSEFEHSWESGQGPLEFYAQHRFRELMHRALASVKNGEALQPSLWNLNTTERTIERSSQGEWMNYQAYVLQPGQWSPIHVPANGEIVFFFLKNREISSEPILDQIQFGKETLAQEAQARFADRLLEIAIQKQALVFPMRIEGEAHDDL